MKKVRLLLLIFIVIAGISAYSQTVKVINQTSLQPIEDVLIINPSGSVTAITNIKGMADINSFPKNDMLIFQHPGFQKLQLSFEQVEKNSLVVKMAERTINLSQIVVSASKWEQNRSEIPNKITFITAKEIAFNNPQTSADLLGNSGEVFIQKSQLGGGSPMIRGFAANSVLLVVDGVRMNNMIYRSGNLQNVINIDPNSVESSEVIFGPGSVIYGSDALGGVMDFHTLTPKLNYDNKYEVGVNAMGRFSSANMEKTGHVDFNIGTSKLGFTTSITYSDFDDLRMGSNNHEEYRRPFYVITMDGYDSIVENDDYNIQKYSGYSQLNLMQKIRYRPSDSWDFQYGFQYSSTSDIPRYDRLIQYSGNKLKYAEWYYGPQDWMMHNINIKSGDSTRLYDKASLIVAYQNYKESRHDRRLGHASIKEQFENVNMYSLNVDFDKSLFGNSHLFYGTEVFFNTLKSTAHERNIETGELFSLSTRYPDGNNRQTSSALYASLKSDISQKITLLAGVRYSYYWLYASYIDSTFYQFSEEPMKNRNGALNGCLGVVFRPNAGWQINTNLSSGFRSPNLDGLAKVFQPSSGSVLVPNPDLSPEYTYNADLGFIKTFNETVEVDFTMFYTFLVDAMVTRDFTFNGEEKILYDGDTLGVIAQVNTGRAQIFGGSFTLKADLNKNFGFKTTMTYMDGYDEDDVPLRHTSPLFGSTFLTYKNVKTKLELYAIYNGTKPYDKLAPSERDKTEIYAEDDNGNPYSPGWWTLNFKGSYQINRYLQIMVGIENIFDVRYRPYSSGIVAPGRNVITTLRVTL